MKSVGTMYYREILGGELSDKKLLACLRERAMLRVNNSSLELRPGFNPWVGKIPWRRKWQPTPILLPGKSHGWRSLAGYSLWGSQKSDTTKQLHFHFLNSMYICLVHAQSCPTLCDLMDCSPPGSLVQQILQARILE